MKRIFFSLAFLLTIGSALAKTPKYIFYFIGDGMGFAHIQMTEAALDAQDGKIGFEPLGFTKFPAKGMAKTTAATRLVTDSAAAGTALATGQKTSIGTIGMNTDHSQNLTSIAEKAKANGRKVGILTSVSIDHATPASFFAHEKSRSMYKEIAEWLPKSEFDLFAGSGLLKISPNYYDSITKHCNYTVVRGKDATLKGDNIVWIEKENKTTDKIALAIDRTNDDMALPEMVEKAISFMGTKKPFFMMVEGGQIDWAAHSNDAASIMHETVDFAQAIEKAIAFYEKHLDETLIVVTADHETGGLSLGRGDRGYDTNLEKLFDQKGSKEVVGKELTNEINKAAGAGFTSGSHTAAWVPVYAIGVGSELFSGVLDNTDIPKNIEAIMVD